MTTANSFPNGGITLSPTELGRLRVGIAVADWNSDITYSLLAGAEQTLRSEGVKTIETLHVPGTIELTYAARKLQSRNDVVIILGCVIQGDTPHFDYVCQSVTEGMTILNAEGKVPVIFGVITVLNREQATDRAGGKLGNKGTEAALTALRMAALK